MSNPLDTEAGSELFSGYEAELKLVHADLTQKLDQIPELMGEPRKAAISQAERAAEEAEELISQLRLSKSSVPTQLRPALNTRFRTHESETKALLSRLNSLRSDRAALMGRYYSDDPTGPSASDAQLEQRQQLLGGTERLERSSQRLKNSQMLASQTEEIGANTLATLGMQREQIQHTQARLDSSEGYVNRSVNTLRGMARRSRRTLCLMFCCGCCLIRRRPRQPNPKKEPPPPPQPSSPTLSPLLEKN